MPNIQYDFIFLQYNKYYMQLFAIFVQIIRNLGLKQIRNIMETKLNRIKVVLVERNVSQKELAAKIGKSFSTVNAYCANRQQPTLETLDQIAQVLNVSMRTLIKED